MREQTMETHVGQHIADACEKAAQLARRHGERIRFSFNDVDLTATPETTAGDLVADYNRKCEECRRAYWTPARLAEKAAREEADRRALADHLDALARIDLVDRAAALRWLCRFEQLKFIHTPCDTGAIVARFGAVGYERNALCRGDGESLEAWCARVGRDGVARWIIGAALDGIASVGAPHGVIHGLAEEWIADGARDSRG